MSTESELLFRSYRKRTQKVTAIEVTDQLLSSATPLPADWTRATYFSIKIPTGKGGDFGPMSAYLGDYILKHRDGTLAVISGAAFREFFYEALEESL